jgi:hypothetical protein
MLHKILLPKFLYEFTGAKSGLQPSKFEGTGCTGSGDCNKGEKEGQGQLEREFRAVAHYSL